MFEKKKRERAMPMMVGGLSFGAGPPPAPPAGMPKTAMAPSPMMARGRGGAAFDREPPEMKASAPADVMQQMVPGRVSATKETGAVALLSRQLASGLWDDGGRGDDETRRIRATARALLELEAEGIDAAHPLHGAQVKKAAAALSALAATVADRTLAELALCVAWLVTRGGRTRAELARRLLNRGIETRDEPTVRARITAALH
jgi:Ca-activated chloride channel family protein